MQIPASHGELFRLFPATGMAIATAGQGCFWQPLAPGVYPQPAGPACLGYLTDWNGGMAHFNDQTGDVTGETKTTPDASNYCWLDSSGRIMAKPGYDWVAGHDVPGKSTQSFLYAFFTTSQVTS